MSKRVNPKIKRKIAREYKKKLLNREELAERYGLPIKRIENILRENKVYKIKYWDTIVGYDKVMPYKLVKPYLNAYKAKKITADEIAQKTNLKRSQVVRQLYLWRIDLWDRKKKAPKKDIPRTKYQKYAKMIEDYFRATQRI